jgi:UDP-glucose 4-epimerase
MRTVLVTGGAGFMGSHLVDRLLEDGAAVRVLDNLSTGSLGNLATAAARNSRPHRGTANGSRLEVVIGDVRDRELLRKALRDVKYVFHLAVLPTDPASITHPGEIHAVNVEGTLNVLHGALTEGVWRLVMGSSSAVYGAPQQIPVAEDTPLQATTLFGASKVAAETYCRAFHARHQLDVVTLRYFSIYGPRQKSTSSGVLIPGLVDAIKQGRLCIQDDERSAEDFAYIDDAVAATLAAARAPRAAGAVINVGSGQMTPISDVLRILADLLQTSVSPVFATTMDAETRRMCASIERAAEVLDFKPRVSLIAGLARLVRSMSEVEQYERHALAPAGGDD